MKTLSGERLSIGTVYRGEAVMIHTNGRTIVIDRDQAEQLMIGLRAVLLEGHEEAFTLDTLEPIRRAAPEFIPQPAAPKRTTPTLDMI